MALVQIRTADITREATGDRPIFLRVKDFNPTPKVPNIKKLFSQQASRCCQCATKGCNRGDAFAPKSPGCPLDTRIPDFLAAVSHADVTRALDRIVTDEESAKLTQDDLDQVIQQLLKDGPARRSLRRGFDYEMDRNVFSEILGTVCPQAQELCESGAKREGTRPTCVSGAAGFEPVAIGNNESLLGKVGRMAGWFEEMLNVHIINQARGKAKHISVIGGGPAGMANAIVLRRMGFKVSIYYREEHIGGLLMYGLPGTKLDKRVVLAYEEILSNNDGISLKPGINVASYEMGKIMRESDAVTLAPGAQTQRSLNIANDSAEGFKTSLDFLAASVNKYNLGKQNVPDNLIATGKDVVIIGGGDTAMDCAHVARREGASKVTILYRDVEEKMKAVEKEVKRAREEGVQFDFRQEPDRIIGEKVAEGIICTVGTGADLSEIPHRARMVINAAGFTGDLNIGRKYGIHGLQQAPNHGIITGKYLNVMVNTGVDEENIKPSEKIFAAGDVVDGAPCLAVHAVASATRAAEQIGRQLRPAARL